MHRGVGGMALLTHVRLSLELFHDDFQEVKEEYCRTFMAVILGNLFFLCFLTSRWVCLLQEVK